MGHAPIGVFFSVGTFFPCDRLEAGECETAQEILRVTRIIPDACSVEGGVARLHWRFSNPIDAQSFWRSAYGKFPALPWNLLHNPSWAATAAVVPDALPEEL